MHETLQTPPFAVRCPRRVITYSNLLDGEAWNWLGLKQLARDNGAAKAVDSAGNPARGGGPSLLGLSDSERFSGRSSATTDLSHRQSKGRICDVEAK